MTKKKDSSAAKLEEVVEQLGEVFARTGHQRIAGRMLGWLLVCDPPQQSADEIQQAIGASKASVSINLRLLQAAGLAQRVGVPGQRRAYYQMNLNAWSSDFKGRLGEITAMRKVADNGLAALAGAPAERRDRLEAMQKFYAFFERAFPAMLEEWERAQAE